MNHKRLTTAVMGATVLTSTNTNNTEVMSRTETEKEISRLDKDISEIKSDVKEIKNNYVTKDYLNNEFKHSLINEIKVMNQAYKKEFRKWLIGTSLVLAIIITALKYFI